MCVRTGYGGWCAKRDKNPAAWNGSFAERRLSGDDESVEMIRRYFKERKLDLVIDYEHQTLQDIQAPAGGWIKDIYKGEDALIAKVEWTQKSGGVFEK